MKQIESNKKIKKAGIPVKYLKRIWDEENYYIEDESCVENMEFINCLFSGVIENTDLENNIFRKCSFKDFYVEKFLFKNTIFDNCYTLKTCIKDSKIICSEFKNSKFLGISFNSCIGSDIMYLNCNCQLADFRGSVLKRTIFEDCNLQEADFQNADLRGVIFKNCDLREAQFSFTKLAGTNFCDSKIEGIKAQYDSFNGAIVDYSQAAYLGIKFLKLKIK